MTESKGLTIAMLREARNQIIKDEKKGIPCDGCGKRYKYEKMGGLSPIGLFCRICFKIYLDEFLKHIQDIAPAVYRKMRRRKKFRDMKKK